MVGGGRYGSVKGKRGVREKRMEGEEDRGGWRDREGEGKGREC